MRDDEGWEARMSARLDEVRRLLLSALHGSEIDVHTEAGRDLIGVVLACVEVALDDYSAHITALGDQLIAEGLTAEQVEELIGKYRQTKSKEIDLG